MRSLVWSGIGYVPLPANGERDWDTCTTLNDIRPSKSPPAFADRLLIPQLYLPMKENHIGVNVNLPKATPKSQPSPLPAKANDTLPLVMTWALADAPAPACASPVA